MGQNADDIGKALRWIAEHGATLTLKSVTDWGCERAPHRGRGVLVELSRGGMVQRQELYPRDGGALCLGTYFALELGQMIKQLERAGAHREGGG